MQCLQTVKGVKLEDVGSNFNHVRRNPPTCPESKISSPGLARDCTSLPFPHSSGRI